MSKFKEAFKKGEENAQRADSRKAEIKGVLEDLDREVYEITGKTLHIALVEREERLTPIARKKLEFENQPVPSYTALIARNKSGRIAELARFSIDSNGYPCLLSLDKQILALGNKEALVEALVNLLQNPEVSKRMIALRSPQKT